MIYANINIIVKIINYNYNNTIINSIENNSVIYFDYADCMFDCIDLSLKKECITSII